MRTPKSLSPSAFMLYEKEPTEYALRYIVNNKPPRSPQPLPASVGSAFDARVKSKLHAAIFGKNEDSKFEFDSLFCDQVEEHNRDEAKLMGDHTFENYVETGSYGELLLLMENAKEAPQFEFDAGRVVNNVPLFGKPDCRFIDRWGNHIILDWKVKGYCSKYGASPAKGYQLCRDGLDWDTRNFTKSVWGKITKEGEFTVNCDHIVAGDKKVYKGKNSQSHNKSHKLYLPMSFNNLTINEGFLETCNTEWATQLSIYGWLMGEKVGDENVLVCIDEIACKYMGEGSRPLIRVANHKARVSSEFQNNLASRLRKLWDAVNSGWLFQDMSKKENDEMLEVLEHRALGMYSDGSEEEDWFSQMGRPAYR